MKITIKDEVLIIHFKGDKQKMNDLLDPISNIYEGIIINREGHNFPSSFIPKKHNLFQYKDKCKYVIGVYHHNSIQHELLHAKFYTDETYKTRIINEWNSLEPKVQSHIHKFLRSMGYDDTVIIDEYQAYRYTEKPNFFGIKL